MATRWIVPVLAVLLVLIGALWTLQGAGVITGGAMSGSRLWLFIGVVAVLAGIGGLVRTATAGRARR